MGVPKIFFAPLRGWALLRHRFWSDATGADIPLNSIIGGGLRLPQLNGIALHPSARIDPNNAVFQGVNLGNVETGGALVFGSYVNIVAGAKLHGPIKLDEPAAMRGNAGELCDIPAQQVAEKISACYRTQTRNGAGVV